MEAVQEEPGQPAELLSFSLVLIALSEQLSTQTIGQHKHAVKAPVCKKPVSRLTSTKMSFF